jgi:hypothetical protein
MTDDAAWAIPQGDDMGEHPVIPASPPYHRPPHAQSQNSWVGGLSGDAPMNATVRLVLIIVLVVLLLGALPLWPYSGGWGWFPSGGLGLLLIIIIILAVMGGGRA